MSPSDESRALLPWEADVTVVIPHRDTPDWLWLSVQMWLKQRSRVFVMVIDTASRHPASFAALQRLKQFPNVEVSSLGLGRLKHRCDGIAAAMDYAFSRCPTDYLVATHVDVFPKHRQLVSYLLSLCGPEQPVVGWEMSPRGAGPRGDREGALSNGYPGHCCTIFHMATMDRIGAGWSIRRAANAFGVRRTPYPGINGWPDTETCLGEILKRSGVRPHFLGRETNGENQVTAHWVHARSRTTLGLRKRHAKAFVEAKARLAAWYAQDRQAVEGDIPTEISKPRREVESCPYRIPKGQKAVCGLLKSLAGASQDRLCVVDRKTCVSCCRRELPTPHYLNPTVATELLRISRLMSLSGTAAETLSRGRWCAKYAATHLLGHSLGYRVSGSREPL